MFRTMTKAGDSSDEESQETARKRTVTSRIIDISKGVSVQDRDVFNTDQKSETESSMHVKLAFSNFTNLKNTGH